MSLAVSAQSLPEAVERIKTVLAAEGYYYGGYRTVTMSADEGAGTHIRMENFHSYALILITDPKVSAIRLRLKDKGGFEAMSTVGAEKIQGGTYSTIFYSPAEEGDCELTWNIEGVVEDTRVILLICEKPQ